MSDCRSHSLSILLYYDAVLTYSFRVRASQYRRHPISTFKKTFITASTQVPHCHKCKQR